MLVQHMNTLTSFLDPRRPNGASTLVSLLLLAPAGCASYSAKPLDARQEASAIVEQKEAEGLYVAAKDLSAPRDSLQFFDRELLAYSYVPVMVLLELDRASEGVFDVRRDDILLCLRDGSRLRTADPLEVAGAVSFSHVRTVFGFVPLIIPGFFVASSVNSANEAIEIDYQLKALKSVRINPNMRSFHSVVFFRIPAAAQGRFTMDDAFLEVKVHKRGNAGAVGKVIEFPVHFGT
jgi:hypothetical protein